VVRLDATRDNIDRTMREEMEGFVAQRIR